jgi:hypothetical protein
VRLLLGEHPLDACSFLVAIRLRERDLAFKRLALGNAVGEALLLEYDELNLDHIELAGVQRSIIGYD